MKTNHRIPLFFTVTFLFGFSLYAYMSILPNYAKSLGASYSMVGLIVGSYGFIQMLLRLPLGIVSDSIGKRKPFIILGITFAAIGAFGMWAYSDIIVLLLSRSLVGVTAASWVVITVLFSDYFAEYDSPKAIGFITAFNTAGQITAMLLGSLAAEKLNIQAPFLIAAAGAIIAVLFSIFIYERPCSADKLAKAANLRIILKDCRLLGFSILGLIVQFATFATVFGFTPVVAKQLGADEFEIGMLSMLSLLSIIPASALCGTALLKRFGYRVVLIISFLIIGMSSAIIPFSTNMQVLYITQFIRGLGAGAALTLLTSLSVSDVPKRFKASAMGFYQAVSGSGIFIGPIVIGAIIDVSGIGSGFLVTGILAFAASWFTAFFMRRAPNLTV